LFHPNISVAVKNAARAVLDTRWIGQGPKVDEFEKKLAFLGQNVLTLNSGTSALELAYHLLGLKKGDEVITPVLNFPGTNLPLIRRGVKLVFADIKDDLSLDFDDAVSRITPKTKAIINTHIFGKINRAPILSVPIIGDAAHYLDKTENEQFTIYSFQATKIITTVDGGALVCKNTEDYKRGKLLRWYGINRETGKDNVEVDITEAGYKYHMNDVAAAMGIAQLKYLDKLKKKREELQECYFKNLSKVTPYGGSPFLIHTKNREKLRKKLESFGIETGLVYKRNDLYSIFGGKRQNLPNMNRLENSYLFLPCHNKMSIKDVLWVCSIMNRHG
jgi:dTDP-4-amino-4,6-dideoxygalactose transaminase